MARFAGRCALGVYSPPYLKAETLRELLEGLVKKLLKKAFRGIFSFAARWASRVVRFAGHFGLVAFLSFFRFLFPD